MWVCGGVCVRMWGVCGVAGVGVCVCVCVLRVYTSFTLSVDFLFKLRSILAALSRKNKTKLNKTNKQTKPNQNQNARFAYTWLMCSTKY